MAALELVDCGPRDLLAESNHRIANHLSLLAGMVQLQAAQVAKGPELFTKTEVNGLLRETAGKIISIGSFHRRLAHKGDTGRCDLGSHIIEYAKEMIASLALSKRLSISERIEGGCIVTPEQAQTAMLIVHEIVMNALKHAHPTGLPVAISLACGRNSDGSISLQVADDGIGFPENFNPGKDGGLGLKLIRSLSEKLCAVLDVETDSLGVSFHLRIPAV
jgi:two-component sensor histidine kinase